MINNRLEHQPTVVVYKQALCGFKNSFHSLLESLLRGFPVDNIPYCTKVFGLAILILKVVGMFPGIDTEQWLELTNDRILVLSQNQSMRRYI